MLIIMIMVIMLIMVVMIMKIIILGDTSTYRLALLARQWHFPRKNDNKDNDGHTNDNDGTCNHAKHDDDKNETHDLNENYDNNCNNND